VACDISDNNAVSNAVEAVTRQFGPIDILINNAGEIMVSPFENLEPADFELAMAVMFWGMLYMTLAVLASMKARRQGRRSAEHAARLVVNAVCARKSETVLGLPAEILSRVHSLLPGFTAEILRFGNSLLPKGVEGASSPRTGRELEPCQGSLYQLLTTLGKRAGQRLNQPVRNQPPPNQPWPSPCK